MAPKRVLFYNSHYKGHNPDYLNYLFAFLQKRNDLPYSTEFYFLLHPALADQIDYSNCNCTVHFANWMRTIEANSRNRHDLLNGLEEWKHLRPFLKQQAITHLFLLRADDFLYVLGKADCRKLDIKISSIIFLLYEHLSANIVTKNHLRRFWKYMQLKWTLRNKNVQQLFILNDPATVSKLNRLFSSTPVFQYLPDPIAPAPETAPAISIREEYDIEASKTLFAIIGKNDPRKNIPTILSAFETLDDNDQSQVALLILGYCEPVAYKEEMEKRLEQLSQTHPNLSVKADFRHLPPAHFHAAFQQVDVVLMLYRNHFASSGILGHAMYYKKPVLAPDLGLLAKLVQKYEMGICVDSSDVAAIRQALLEIRTFAPQRPELLNAYLQKHTTEAFSQFILEGDK